MPAFVIARKNEQYLDAPVFHAGPNLDEEAVAVFTKRSLAQAYIDEAGWADDHSVESLTAMQLLRWMIHAHEDRAQYLTIDLDRTAQLAGEPQRVLAIEEKLADFAEQLTRAVLARRMASVPTSPPAEVA